MEERKNNKKKIFIYSILGIITVLIITLTITYAYWLLTREQTGENVVNTACLNISFTGENDINLPKIYPMTNEQLDKFLSTETPYHFTIHNECDDLANVTINLESLNAGEEKQLEDQYINAVLYENDYKVNLNSEKKLIERIYNDENKVIANSLHAYELYNFVLKKGETKSFNLLLYMDPDTPMETANMNASWKGKITLSSEYKEEDTTIRIINNTRGMWNYKDKLAKIVIENKKSVKTGEKVYGPFDESADGYGGVQSYVVCESDDTNCVGYLQSNGKIKANTDSSRLFDGFSNVTEIKGLENLDTSKVISMKDMFRGLSNLTTLDISSFNTSKVEDMSYMFYSLGKIENIIFPNNFGEATKNMSYMFYNLPLTEIDLSKFNTSKVENMSHMFEGARNIETLNIEIFNTSNVKNMYYMFYGMYKLSNITLPNNFGSACTNMSFMFSKIKYGNKFTLDLTGMDTRNAENMLGMFEESANIEHITFGPNFVHKQDATTSYMFSDCPAPERPIDDSWSGVSF